MPSLFSVRVSPFAPLLSLSPPLPPFLSLTPSHCPSSNSMISPPPPNHTGNFPAHGGFFFWALCLSDFLHMWLWRHSFRPFSFHYLSLNHSFILTASENKKERRQRAFFPSLLPSHYLSLCGWTLVFKLFFLLHGNCPYLALPACVYMCSLLAIDVLYPFFFRLVITQTCTTTTTKQKKKEGEHTHIHLHPQLLNRTISYFHIDTYIYPRPTPFPTPFNSLFLFWTSYGGGCYTGFPYEIANTFPSSPLDWPSPSWVHFCVSSVLKKDRTQKDTILTLVFISFLPSSSPPFLLSSLYLPSFSPNHEFHRFVFAIHPCMPPLG